MSRFQLGQKVLVMGAISTKHQGREATVINVPAEQAQPPQRHIARQIHRAVRGRGSGRILRHSAYGYSLTREEGAVR